MLPMQRVAMIEAEAAFPSLSDDAESRRLQHEREERQCEAAERKCEAAAAKPKRLMDFIASHDSSPASLFGPAGSTSLGLKALEQEPAREPVSRRAVAAPDASGRFGGGGGCGGGGGGGGGGGAAPAPAPARRCLRSAPSHRSDRFRALVAQGSARASK